MVKKAQPAQIVRTDDSSLLPLIDYRPLTIDITVDMKP